VTVSSESELSALRRIGRIVALTREEVVRHIRPGVTTAELDAVAAATLAAHGATSAPILDYSFPGHTCISLNDVAAHGIPGSQLIREGDIVNVDVSAVREGFYADTGITVAVAPAAPQREALCRYATEALEKCLAQATAGTRLNALGRAISDAAAAGGFSVIRNLTGHGIGRRLHEPPHDLLNYYDRRVKGVLTTGLVLAVETFISERADYVRQDADGWTLRTPDGSWVAQSEHTIVITEGEPIILTAL